MGTTRWLQLQIPLPLDGYSWPTVCFASAFLKVSKIIKDKFSHIWENGLYRVEKSQRAVIQVSCDLVLTSLDFERHPDTRVSPPVYKEQTLRITKNHLEFQLSWESIWKCVRWRETRAAAAIYALRNPTICLKSRREDPMKLLKKTKYTEPRVQVTKKFLREWKPCDLMQSEKAECGALYANHK